jgi:hypothetical protein
MIDDLDKRNGHRIHRDVAEVVAADVAWNPWSHEVARPSWAMYSKVHPPLDLS